MSRVAGRQPDLFAPPQSDRSQPAAPPPPVDPIAELQSMLAMVRAAERLPWPNLSAAMAAEYQAMHLAGLAGKEGKRLLTAIFEETERLHALTD